MQKMWNGRLVEVPCCTQLQVIKQGGGMFPDGIAPPLPSIVPNCTPVAIHAHAVTLEWTTHNIPGNGNPGSNYTQVEISNTSDTYNQNTIVYRSLIYYANGAATKVERATLEHKIDDLDPNTQYYWRVVQYQPAGNIGLQDDVIVSISRQCTFRTRAANDENYFVCAPIIPQDNPNYITGGVIAAQVGVASPLANFQGTTEIGTSPNGPWTLATGSQANPVTPNGFNTYAAWQVPGGLTPNTNYWLRFTYTWTVPNPDETVQQLICGPYRTSAP